MLVLKRNNSSFFFSDVSRNSKVSISIYLRQPPQTNGPEGVVVARASNDHFLGNITIQPNFYSTNMEDQVYNISGGTGAMFVQLCYTPEQVIINLIRSLHIS